MSNITLAVNDELLAASRAAAARRGMSLNAYIRSFLEGAVKEESRVGQKEQFFAISKAATGNSGGWTFSRDEANER